MRLPGLGLLVLLLAASPARADRAAGPPVDDASLIVKVYRVLTSPKHILPTDAGRVARAALEALSSGDAKAVRFGADAAANAAVLEREARVRLAERKTRDASRAAALASIRAMISAADDPHTFLFDPTLGPTLTALVEGRAGAASGAAFARLHDGRLVVTEVQPKGPAEKAGLKPGDVLAKIDGRPPASLSDIFTLVGRAGGPPIPLTVQRPGSAKPVDVAYSAFEWTPPNVEGRLLAGNVGYLRFRFFSAPAPERIREELAGLERAGGRALVLDLRGNWGGIPDAVPSVFIDGDPIVLLRDGAGKEVPVSRSGAAWPRPLPMVVLVDGGTYSAAEFLAFALKDRKAALILGTPTGGGLTGVDDIELADGYLLHVANTLVIGPVSHSASAGHRVTPDRTLAERTPEELAAGVDRQLDAAVAEAARRAER